ENGRRNSHSSRSPTLVGARPTLRRLLDGDSRRGDRARRPPLDQDRAWLLRAGAAMGAQRLCHHVRRPATARRTRRRPARETKDVRRRLALLHHSLTPLRACLLTGGSHFSSRCPGVGAAVMTPTALSIISTTF